MRSPLVGVLCAVALVLAACGSVDAGAGGPREGQAKGRTLNVFAAASLEPTFTELAEEFERQNDDVVVTLNFAGSQDLQEQILEGARADVFASANEAQMEPVAQAGLTDGEPVVFATNFLVIVTPPSNPAGIFDLTDLADPAVTLVICAPEVPCGTATQTIIESAGITLKPVSEEQSVTDVLAKVQADEADAGLVYRTDAISAGQTVEQITFPQADVAVNRNPIAALNTGAQRELARSWVDFILSPAVQERLAKAGFGPANDS